MRVILQRVLECELRIDDKVHSAIGQGILVLTGIEEEDTEADAVWLASKICSMRIFSDEEGKMNLDLNQIKGELMIVSQFTLFASTKKGNRPSFIRSAKPEKAKALYEYFIRECEKLIQSPVKTGVFAADMKIRLVNDGPVTIPVDSRNRE